MLSPAQSKTYVFFCNGLCFQLSLRSNWQLLFKSETQYFTPGSLVADMREPADKIMIVSSGSIDLYVYSCDLVFDSSTTDVRFFFCLILAISLPSHIFFFDKVSFTTPVFICFAQNGCKPLLAVWNHTPRSLLFITWHSLLTIPKQQSSKFRARVIKRGYVSLLIMLQFVISFTTVYQSQQYPVLANLLQNIRFLWFFIWVMLSLGPDWKQGIIFRHSLPYTWPISSNFIPHLHFMDSFSRDVIGDSALVGDPRWAGTFGVSGDFIARDNCR